MTRPEITGKRNLDFSGWVRKNLPDSYDGFRVTDLDFVLCNERTKKLMFLEAKIYGGPKREKKWQNKLFNRIDKWIKNGVEPDWEYLGFHMVVFGNTAPNNGYISFDGGVVTEEELVKLLSF